MEAGGKGLDEEEGVVWWCVMIVEYRNAFNKLAHDPFCTACPGLGTCPGLDLSRLLSTLTIKTIPIFIRA